MQSKNLAFKFRGVVLQLQFPEIEFKKIASSFIDASSIRYRVKESFFYLGIVQSAHKQGPEEVIITLEIRKDETPAWYARSIIEKARGKEIFVMKDSEAICKGGKIVKVEGLDQCSENDIVEPLEIWIVPRKAKRRF